MRNYYVCTCIKSHIKRPYKYHRANVDSEGICLNCNHYAISIPNEKSLDEVNEVMGLRYKEDTKEEETEYPVHNVGNAKPLRWTYGY